MPPLQTLSLRPSADMVATAPTIGTYNVHWLAQKAQLRKAFAALANVNVWCLQEVRVDASQESHALAMFDEILPPGPWHIVIARANRLDEINSHDFEAQAIISRFPISDARLWLLDSSGAKRRVALSAQIEVDGHPIRIINTDHEPSFFAWQDRNRVQLRSLIARLADVDEPCVALAGDFNCSGNLWRGYGNATHVNRLNAAFAKASLLPANLDKPTFSSWPLSLSLDRIYLRNLSPSASSVANIPLASDHLPAWCALQFKPPTTAPRSRDDRTMHQ